jgi:hypothetical protein
VVTVGLEAQVSETAVIVGAVVNVENSEFAIGRESQAPLVLSTASDFQAPNLLTL